MNERTKNAFQLKSVGENENADDGGAVSNLPCNVMLFLSNEIDRSLLLICNAFASSLAPMSPIKLPLISVPSKWKEETKIDMKNECE